MSWDDNGKDEKPGKNRNPWGTPDEGKKPGSPWGTGNDPGPRGQGGRRGSSQPDFDDIFGKFQNNMRGMFGGGGGHGGVGGRGGAPAGGKFILLGAGVVAALWLASGFYILNPGEHAVVQRFGAWNRTVDTEGLKYRLPSPIETATKFNVNEIRTMNVGFTTPGPTRGNAQVPGRDVPDESLMLTSDFNIVDLDFIVQWNIKSAEEFLFNIEDPENSLRKAAQSAIREVVGQTRMFPIITTERGRVAENAKAIMQKILDDYKSGINITQVLINSARVHPDVQSAFQDVQAAKQDAEDVQNRAQAYREDIIPKARGAATRVVEEAEGYKQSVISRATGDADRFNSVLSSYQSGPDVTKERIYIETMEDVLKNAQKIIVDDKGGSGVVPYLPLNELTRTAPAAGDSRPGNRQGNPLPDAPAQSQSRKGE